jgi:hypothetical protein
MIDELDDTDDNEDLESEPFDLNSIKEDIHTYSSDKLCEMIVCDRYFGCYKEIAIFCMEELAKRRINGDQFDFESHIEKSLSEMPKIDLSIPDLGNVLRQLTGKGFFK